ncbi:MULTISPECIES: hypothetical protein [Dehalococcoides]|jgi:hypothetical protein|uniref:Uncharacterized protein n=2 Tax=Dehalococcoides mccartyi TaxID=61435 RepID=A0A142VA08_9CHLR|nr:MULTISPECIES: hypothetical protein [Dehalococcoides]AGG06484.1 hypothetical protein dcmb_873 [Dehalococcoides mccartyi DCMB5]AGG07923.1 hypothetical protein btf_835 [Dehalococcoides mccartyi BTF08]AII60994.1 hypothetical protein X794_04050 [Dehalococcoides mccartyi CG5]AMU86618.1 hypothetical protein Dm11a5_0792 [Dehalococcoides mccartyi]AOV99442.1 hypothetical protein DCWBC2_0804 [Dehalococcoides mccartyi]
MADWQITACTILCEAVCDEITIIVKEDGSVRCTAFDTYGSPSRDTLKEMAKKAKKCGHSLKCEGPLCHRVINYRDKIMNEERQQNESG